MPLGVYYTLPPVAPMLGESARPHTAQPWLFDMRLATVCMSTYGPVYSICTHQPKPIWA